MEAAAWTVSSARVLLVRRRGAACPGAACPGAAAAATGSVRADRRVYGPGSAVDGAAAEPARGFEALPGPGTTLAFVDAAVPAFGFGF